MEVTRMRTASTLAAELGSSDGQSADLEAYNEAFLELELPWHWDPATFASLRRSAGDADYVSAYVERHQPHLLKVYDRGFLRNLILSTMARRLAAHA